MAYNARAADTVGVERILAPPVPGRQKMTNLLRCDWLTPRIAGAGVAALVILIHVLALAVPALREALLASSDLFLP